MSIRMGGSGTCNQTSVRWYTQGEYRGKPIMLMIGDTFGSCQHHVVPMHHTDAKGRHYCPTGIVWCPLCGGTAEEPKPYACTRWEQPWWDQVLAYLKVLYR